MKAFQKAMKIKDGEDEFEEKDPESGAKIPKMESMFFQND